VREALATLPWVEQGSIDANVPSRKVVFNVKDKDKFDFDKLKDALKEQDFKDVELISGPDKAPKKK
jgi:hypothetical protein